MADNPRKKTEQVNIRITQEMRDELRTLAEGEHRPLANYIVAVLAEHLAAKRAGSPDR